LRLINTCKGILTLSFCLYLLNTNKAKTQDVHFSQYYFAPQAVNPANTGNFDGAWRINNNFRRQWGLISPYSTFALAADKQMGSSEKFSMGIMVMNDRSNSSALQSNHFYLSGAYNLGFGKSALRLGLQSGVVSRNFNAGKLSFPDQFDNESGGFNSSLGTSETGFNENVSFLDVNAGALWKGNYGNIKPYAGFAAYHVFTTNQSFFKSELEPTLRNVFNAGLKTILSTKFYFTPSILYMTNNKATELITGSSFTYVINPSYMETSVFGGVFSRNEFKNFDALIFLIGGNYLNWTFGLSYDINMSDLNVEGRNPGGFELSIIFKEISTKIEKIYIPCERF